MLVSPISCSVDVAAAMAALAEQIDLAYVGTTEAPSIAGP
jgi:hypothetical protein